MRLVYRAVLVLYSTYESFSDGILIDGHSHHQVHQVVKAPEIPVQRPIQYIYRYNKQRGMIFDNYNQIQLPKG